MPAQLLSQLFNAKSSSRQKNPHKMSALYHISLYNLKTLSSPCRLVERPFALPLGNLPLTAEKIFSNTPSCKSISLHCSGRVHRKRLNCSPRAARNLASISRLWSQMQSSPDSKTGLMTEPLLLHSQRSTLCRAGSLLADCVPTVGADD